jgi:hypothetical protein
MLNSQIRTVTTSLEEMNRNERVLLKKRTQLLLDLLSEDCLENRENLFCSRHIFFSKMVKKRKTHQLSSRVDLSFSNTLVFILTNNKIEKRLSIQNSCLG